MIEHCGWNAGLSAERDLGVKLRSHSLNVALLRVSQSTLRRFFLLFSVVLACSSREFVLNGIVSPSAVARLFAFSRWVVRAFAAFSIAGLLKDRQIVGSLLLVWFVRWGFALACSSRGFVLNGALLCHTWMCPRSVFDSAVSGALSLAFDGTKGRARADRIKIVFTGWHLRRWRNLGRSQLWVFSGDFGSIRMLLELRVVRGVGSHNLFGFVVIGMKGASDMPAQSIMEGVFPPSSTLFTNRLRLFILIPT